MAARKERLLKRVLFAAMLCGVAAVLSVVVACGDDDGGGSDEEKQELADLAVALAAASPDDQAQVDNWLAHVTDTFIGIFFPGDRAECEASVEECIGEPLSNPAVDTGSVEIDGDSATLLLTSDEGDFGMTLVNDEDVWKADTLFVPDDEVPEGTEVVELELIEFAFDGDLESDAVKSGDFALHVVNAGEQPHELVIVKIPEGQTLDDVLNSEEQPEIVTVKLPYLAGDESDVAFDAPLEAGAYGMVCFFPDTEDPEGTPHAFLGMTAEFTVE
jgi:hypothetical protein